MDAARLSRTCHISSMKQLQVASGHRTGQRRSRCPKCFSSLKSSNLTQIYLNGAHYGSLFSDTHCVILIYRFKFSCSVRTFFLKYCFWYLFHCPVPIVLRVTPEWPGNAGGCFDLLVAVLTFSWFKSTRHPLAPQCFFSHRC